MSVQISNASGADHRRTRGRCVLLGRALRALACQALAFPALAFPALATLAPVAQAAPAVLEARDPAPPSGGARPGPRDGSLRSLADRQVSMDEAIDMAQRRYNARVVRAEVSERGGRRVYLLRLLSDDGRVFNVRIDAATGSIQ